MVNNLRKKFEAMEKDDLIKHCLSLDPWEELNDLDDCSIIIDRSKAGNIDMPETLFYFDKYELVDLALELEAKEQK